MEMQGSGQRGCVSVSIYTQLCNS